MLESSPGISAASAHSPGGSSFGRLPTMDPLSISSSVIAIATLAAEVCSKLSELRSLYKSLPGRLHAVNNEVADLEVVLLEVAFVVKKRQTFLEKELSSIPHLLKQAYTKLNELKAIVFKLTAVCRAGRVPISLVLSWRKEEQTKLQVLQDDLRTIKSSLNIMLGASNSSVSSHGIVLHCGLSPKLTSNARHDMMKIRLEIESFSTITAHSMQQQQVALQNHFSGALVAVNERIARVEEMLREQALQVSESQTIQVGSSYIASQPRQRLPGISKPTVLPASPRSEGIGVRVAPFIVTCGPKCICACHREKKSATPAFLDQVVGRLFVGYSGIPAFSPRCTLDTCQKSRASQVSLEYWFPIGFWSSTIVRMQVGYQPNVGSLLQLDTLRRVPDTAQCVNFALNGDIEGLKYLFTHGLASPRDISTTRGYSVLRWALYGKQYETCEFLIHAGADPDYRPIAASDNSPKNKACHFLLEGGLPDNAVKALRTITKGGYLDEFIENSNFTQTHKIILGISMNNLEEEIIQHPEDINAVDAMGRTPLAWAAARGDTRAIVTLLSQGADPNIMDVQLSGPLSNAAAQGHTVSVRLLLEAGAYPDTAKLTGVRKGSPLNCAARNSRSVVLLKSLLDFGAEVDASGTDGKTALLQAARIDNPSFAMLLLEYGADINATAADDSTPLTTAITYNSHNVLRLILDRWHEYSSCPRLKGPHLLQIVALYADLETINILAGTDHFRAKYDNRYTHGDFSDHLRQRPDFTEKLAVAFDELLTIINQRPVVDESLDSLMEAGFFSCLPSRVNSRQEDMLQEPGSPASSDESFADALDYVSIS